MKEQILVIDDQQDFIDLLKMLLGAHLPETEVVGDMDRLLRRTLGEDVELVTLLNEVPCMIEADAGQIGQVVMNLAVTGYWRPPMASRRCRSSRRTTMRSRWCSQTW